MTRLLHVVGARPNFMKVAPILRVPSSLEHVLVHTGQHYDASMSDAFFRDLDLPAPDVNLGVGSGTHAEQTARIMLALGPVLEQHRPDWVVVYGDVNSTLAGALVAQKQGIPVAHVEAGVRSFDLRMPEEVNRLLTDQLASLCLTPSASADANLAREGIAAERIRMVGNVMVDSLLAVRDRATALDTPGRLGVKGTDYVVATFHRAANVDDPAVLAELLDGLARLATRFPVLFLVHPRTRKRIAEAGLDGRAGDAWLLDPVGYLEMVGLVQDAALVVTDSGGLQVETTILGVPCLTTRPVTEWTETVTQGTNRLVAPVAGAIEAAAMEMPARGKGVRPPLWDGRTAGRIVAALS